MREHRLLAAVQLAEYLVLRSFGRGWLLLLVLRRSHDLKRPVLDTLLWVFGMQTHGGPRSQLELGHMWPLPRQRRILLLRSEVVEWRLDLNLVCLDGWGSSARVLLGFQPSATCTHVSPLPSAHSLLSRRYGSQRQVLGNDNLRGVSRLSLCINSSSVAELL